MNRFHVTYDVVTPESAERGDIADCGFVTPDGPESVRQIWGEAAGKVKAACAMRLRDALQLVSPQEETGGAGFAEVDGRTDYRTGAEERRTLHAPDKITAASYARLRRVLGFPA